MKKILREFLTWSILVIAIVGYIFISLSSDLYSSWDIGVKISTEELIDPIEGDMWYNTTRNALYVYEDGQWKEPKQVPDTKPSSPRNSDMWFDEESEILFTYHDEPITVDKIKDKLQDGNMWKDWGILTALVFGVRLTLQFYFIDKEEEKNSSTKELKESGQKQSTEIRNKRRVESFKYFVDNTVAKELILKKYIRKLRKKINKHYIFIRKKKRKIKKEELINTLEKMERLLSLLYNKDENSKNELKDFNFSSIMLKSYKKPIAEEILDSHIKTNKKETDYGDFSESKELTKTNIRSIVSSAFLTILMTVFLADLFINWSSFNNEIIKILYGTCAIVLAIFFAYLTGKNINDQKNYQLKLANGYKEIFNENAETVESDIRYQELKQMQETAILEASEAIKKKIQESVNHNEEIDNKKLG